MAEIQSDASYPQIVDDSGTGRDGSPIDAAFLDGIAEAVNAQTHSATNPTVTPANIVDEVVTARGSTASLDARLDQEHNEDGTHKTTGTLGTLVTVTQLMGGLGAVNLVPNDDFLVWCDGDAAVPTGWTLTGAGGSVARAGSGLADTTRKVGDFCMKVTRAGTNVNVSNILLQGAAFSRADFIKGQYVTAGMWVKCSTPNIARVAVSDSASTAYSSYHTGGGTWEWLACTRQISLAAASLVVAATVHNSDGSAWFDGVTSILLNANLTVASYQPSPVVYGALHFSVSGVVAGASNVHAYAPARIGILKDVQLYANTAPTGQALIVDLNTWDGASFTSMFATRPQLAAGAQYGNAQPDGTYARRCVRGLSAAAVTVSGLLNFDVDQVGSGVAGSDLRVEARLLQYQSPLERFQTS
jgi:hypothetical protein